MEEKLKSYFLLISCSFALFFLLSHCTIPEAEDIDPPTVSLIYPISGIVVSGNIVVTVQASDNKEISQVWYTLDGQILGKSHSERSDFELDVTDYGDNQNHVFQAGAVDNSGNNAVSEQAVVVISKTGDLTPPSLVLLYPQDGDSLSGTVRVSVDVFDNVSVDRVEYYVDGGQANTGLPNFVATTGPWSFNWDTNPWADRNEHTLYIRAVDTSENQTTLGPLKFTIL